MTVDSSRQIGAAASADHLRPPRETGPPGLASPIAVVQLGAAVLVVILAIGAFVVELPVVAHGSAIVVPTLPLQPVEPVNGGRVKGLRVQEGDHVEAGDVVAEVVNLEILSSLAERRIEKAALSVKAARLRAEAAGVDFVPDPASPPHAARREADLWRSRSASREADRTALESQRISATAERREILAKLEAARTLVEIARKRRDFMNANSRATVIQLLDLERDVADRQGAVDGLVASAARAAAAVDEADSRTASQEAAWRRDTLAELVEAESRIDVISENERAAAARLDEAALTTPVRGIVQTIHAGPGRVVAPGSPVLDIVPLTDRLLVEAKIPPLEVAGLHPGLQAVVRLDALDYRTYGALAGTVVTMSPDAIQDPTSGALYYRVRVATVLTPEQQQSLVVIPGMTGTVDIELGRRRVAAYLFRPVGRVMERAFRE